MLPKDRCIVLSNTAADPGPRPRVSKLAPTTTLLPREMNWTKVLVMAVVLSAVIIYVAVSSYPFVQKL